MYVCVSVCVSSYIYTYIYIIYAYICIYKEQHLYIYIADTGTSIPADSKSHHNDRSSPMLLTKPSTVTCQQLTTPSGAPRDVRIN